MTEQWKDIEGWSLHQISDEGRVRALPGARMKGTFAMKIELRILTQMATGYMAIAKGNRYLYVHSLVLTAFRGPRPEGAQSRHLNGNPTDNRLSNLQ